MFKIKILNAIISNFNFDTQLQNPVKLLHSLIPYQSVSSTFSVFVNLCTFWHASYHALFVTSQLPCICFFQCSRLSFLAIRPSFFALSLELRYYWKNGHSSAPRCIQFVVRETIPRRDAPPPWANEPDGEPWALGEWARREKPRPPSPPWRIVNIIANKGHKYNRQNTQRLFIFDSFFVRFKQFDVFIRLYVLYLCHYVIYIWHSRFRDVFAGKLAIFAFYRRNFSILCKPFRGCTTIYGIFWALQYHILWYRSLP